MSQQMPRDEAKALGQASVFISGGVALAATACAVLLGWKEPQQFFRSYLFAYTFWLGLPLGAMVFAMIHPLAGGVWGLMLRPGLLLCLRTMPLLAVLFLPLIGGFSYLYSWAHLAPGSGAEPVVWHRAAYMNATFVSVRAVVLLLLWSGLALLLARLTRRYDPAAGAAPNRLRNVAAAGLVLLFVTSAVASVDWLMSLETEYYSTVYALICLAGQSLLALSFAIAWSAAQRTRDTAAPKQWRDLGSLLATNVLLWAYLQYSQLIINWSGNGAKEIPWYLHRSRLGWGSVAAVLIVVNFAAPFFILLFRGVKDNARALGRVAGALVLIQILNVYWLVEPSFGVSARGSLHAVDLLVFLAIGGIWMTAVLMMHRSSPAKANLTHFQLGAP